MSINIGIDHGYYAIKTAHFSFPAGIVAYSSEPYTLQNTLKYGGSYYVCGTGRQPIQRNKTANENYYLLTLVAIAKELRQRGGSTAVPVRLAVGLPLTSYGREKQPFKEYLLRSSQPVCFEFERTGYEITIEEVVLFPQGYSALSLFPDILTGEPSVLLMDIGGWTVDLMRLDNRRPNASTCRSLELGLIRCIDETAEQIRRDYGLSVTDSQIARLLALPGAEKDLATRAEPFSLNSLAWLKPGSLSICTLKILGKMFPACSRMTAAGHLQPSSIRWTDWGFSSFAAEQRMKTTGAMSERRSSAVCPRTRAIKRSRACPKQDAACILSDILMADVEERYFLSPKQQEQLLCKQSAAAKASESTPPQG